MAPPVHGARERLADFGIDVLTDVELVSLLLGTGCASLPAPALAQRLLDNQGGLAGLSRAGVGELSLCPGVGLAKGARIAAAVELGKRVAIAGRGRSDARMPDARAVYDWSRARLAGLDHEELWALALDGHHRLRAARRVASGGLHGMFVSARDPLRAALREGASAFVLVHNHPSGDPNPSEEDVAFTLRVAAAAGVIGTPLLDHVVVAETSFTSMLSLGLIPDEPASSPGLLSPTELGDFAAALHTPASRMKP
jgi:DNA repair protein RadC